jgi:outer membrane receptor for ferric coprogen and ferric-rhodotorulic acid
MFRPNQTARLAILAALALGAAGLMQATPAAADVLVRGGKARIVTSPAAPGGQSRGTSGYYVPYVTGPGGQQVPVMQVPGSVTVVPRRLMDDTQATTLGEALRYVPGVFVGR